MQPRQQTHFLILLLLASATAAVGAWSLLNSGRNEALASLQDREICLTEMAAIQGSASATIGDKTGSGDDLAINRRLRGAAVAAHLADQLISIDPGAAVRLQDSDFMQTPIFVRLNAVSLRQLVGFLYQLSMSDNDLRSSDIELSPPLAIPMNRSDPGDLWTADVTLSYLSYQQRSAAESR